MDFSLTPEQKELQSVAREFRSKRDDFCCQRIRREEGVSI
ncbi:MAG: hypothetical protein Ct9H300mP20_03190 [Gammaproteobacteria bacterium]|nr:MAG: hypothetical protein Ct9H300mP20_03190 [Gammaproteobacteria bacterium]